VTKESVRLLASTITPVQLAFRRPARTA